MPRDAVSNIAAVLFSAAALVALARCASNQPGSPAPSASRSPPPDHSTRPPPRNMHPPTDYHVDLRSPETQTATISMILRDVREPTLDVALPVWRPGKYAILDPAGSISAVAARDAHSQPLPISKIDKTTWRIHTNNSGVVRVSYRLYANSLSDRTRHIDDTHAFLSPSTVFLYPLSRRLAPARVTFDTPPAWRVATGLVSDPDAPSAFLAPTYDVLVDSPIEIGIHDRHTFELDAVPHDIIVWHAGTAQSAPPVYDHLKFSRDFAAIVRAQRDIFGDLPYSRFVYLIHSGPGLGGGTEHLNSTIMQTSRATFEDTGAYKRFLGLVSHEMFHTWNVKQLRPADLHPYDYAHENYTRLLWLVEGATSYYDDLCLVRAGLIEPDAYLAMIESMIASELARPGWHEQSLEESSFDAWIKFNRPSPDTANTTVSFYSKGALISLLLDMQIRTRTAGAASLDHVFRTLYQRFPLSGPGYTTADVLAAIRDTCRRPASSSPEPADPGNDGGRERATRASSGGGGGGGGGWGGRLLRVLCTLHRRHRRPRP